MAEPTAVQFEEEMGAHPVLTDIVVTLGKLRERVADYAENGPPVDNPSTSTEN